MHVLDTERCRRFRKPVKRVPGKFGQRYYKNIGLGYRTPKSAIEGAAREDVKTFGMSVFDESLSWAVPLALVCSGTHGVAALRRAAATALQGCRCCAQERGGQQQQQQQHALKRSSASSRAQQPSPTLLPRLGAMRPAATPQRSPLRQRPPALLTAASRPRVQCSWGLCTR